MMVDDTEMPSSRQMKNQLVKNRTEKGEKSQLDKLKNKNSVFLGNYQSTSNLMIPEGSFMKPARVTA